MRSEWCEERGGTMGGAGSSEEGDETMGLVGTIGGVELGEALGETSRMWICSLGRRVFFISLSCNHKENQYIRKCKTCISYHFI